MELEFVNMINTTEQLDMVAFAIFDKKRNIQIGYAEGHLTKGQFLISVINLFEGFRNKGLGRTVFLRVIESLGGQEMIRGLMGSWHRGEEFNHLEKNRSTNLLIFQEYLQKGYIQQEAAETTPSGKWAASLGYSEVEILSVSESDASVLFTKPK